MANEQESEEVQRFKATREKAEQGDARAQYGLGKMYLDGYSVSKNDEEAAKWMQEAAEQGDAEAQFLLAGMYAKGEGVPPNYVEAVKWSGKARKAAEEGDAETQFKMGVRYHKIKDYVEGAKWYRKAAEQGHAKAQDKLGCMYANGEGVSQDYDKAAKWLWKGVQGEDVSPQVKKVMIALMYNKGKGVLKNDVEAYAWFLLAKANGHEEVSKGLEEALNGVISSHAAILTAEQIKKGKARAAELRRLYGAK